MLLSNIFYKLLIPDLVIYVLYMVDQTAVHKIPTSKSTLKRGFQFLMFKFFFLFSEMVFIKLNNKKSPSCADKWNLSYRHDGLLASSLKQTGSQGSFYHMFV